jgi:hypothetical protein
MGIHILKICKFFEVTFLSFTNKAVVLTFFIVVDFTAITDASVEIRISN